MYLGLFLNIPYVMGNQPINHSWLSGGIQDKAMAQSTLSLLHMSIEWNIKKMELLDEAVTCCTSPNSQPSDLSRLLGKFSSIAQAYRKKRSQPVLQSYLLQRW